MTMNTPNDVAAHSPVRVIGRMLNGLGNCHDVELFISCGISAGDAWMTCYRKPNDSLVRFKRAGLPIRKTPEQAADDLMTLAMDKGWNRTHVCRSCGCDTFHACRGGCSWALPSFCDRCLTEGSADMPGHYSLLIAQGNVWRFVNAEGQVTADDARARIWTDYLTVEIEAAAWRRKGHTAHVVSRVRKGG